MPAPLHCPGCQQQIPVERLNIQGNGGLGICPRCQYVFLLPRPEATGGMADPHATKGWLFVGGMIGGGVLVVLVCCGGLSYLIF